MAGKTASPLPTRIATGAPAPGRWIVDAAASSLQISVKFGFVATVTGRFGDVRGRLDIDETLLNSVIAVEVGTASLTSGSSHWDSVLLTAGLVDSVANPTISFESTDIATRGHGWLLGGVLVTERGCLPVQFDLQCVGEDAARIRFRATGSIGSKDAVRLLSQPGVERLIGRSMTVDLVVEAVRLG